jgi:hypothetical protein
MDEIADMAQAVADMQARSAEENGGLGSWMKRLTSFRSSDST